MLKLFINTNFRLNATHYFQLFLIGLSSQLLQVGLDRMKKKLYECECVAATCLSSYCSQMSALERVLYS